MLRHVVVLLACVTAASAALPRPQDILTTIRRSAPSVVAVPPPSQPKSAFAGEYTEPPELARRIGPMMNGSSVYLFPDGSYLFVRWGDILPPTIYDRGAWHYDGQLIQLVSDGSLPAKEAISGAMIPVQVQITGKRQLCLLSMLSYRKLALERATDDLSFLTWARSRVRTLSPARAKTVKARLLREAWNPKWFTTKRPNSAGYRLCHGLPGRSILASGGSSCSR